MSKAPKKRPASGGTSGATKKEKAITSKSIPRHAPKRKAFDQAVADTEAEAGTIIDGIVTMKVYYEAGAILRHSVTVTKKYREQGQV
ncbi:hypothetical protein FACS1894110_24450 [Spirochaetia bacterium]|nr:hypothetical protein FACS1894110_24450 [Spirochaetia bacterium]